ncbi:MAG: PAS domain S-box protein, partial [Flavobacterium sp.]
MNNQLLFLNNIVENAPLPIAVYVGDELEISLANPAMITTWGKGDEVVGKKYREILPELENQQIFDQVMNVMKTGIPYHAKNSRVDLVIDDELLPHYFNYSFTPLYDTHGDIYGVMNTATDVTDLNLARQEVQYSEQSLRLAIDTAGFGTYEVDFRTNKIKTSGNFNAIWCIDKDFSNEDLVQKMHPDDWPLREKAHQQAVLTGQMCYDARILNDDGSFKWVQINGKVISDINDTPLTLIGIVQDISEQRLFEDELKK